MDLNNLYTLINNEIIDKKFGVAQDDLSYLIDIENLDNILLFIFNISSSNEYSFSINRDDYNRCLIYIFDKISSTKKIISLFYIRDKNSFRYKINSKFYTIRNSILKAITIIPLIGPDGAGKTTLLTTITDSLNQKYLLKVFKRITRRSIVFNLTYPLNVYKLKKKGIKKGKNEISDQNPGLVIMSGLTYYPYLIMIAFFQKKLIFVDRFFQDSLMENIRFIDKIILLRKNWKTLLKFIPITFWIIQLDAKNEIILSRKNELSYDDIDKYRELNFKIYLEKPAVIYSYINTGNDLENCKNTILTIGDETGVLKKVTNES